MKLRTIRQRSKVVFSRNLGKRCRTYGAGCMICECYRHLLHIGRFPYTFDEMCEYQAKHDMDAPEISWDALSKSINYAEKFVKGATA